MRAYVQIFGQQPGLAATLTQLQMARLPKVSDEGLTSLSNLSALHCLNLAHTPELTWKGLAALRNLSQLTALKCGPCRAGLFHSQVYDVRARRSAGCLSIEQRQRAKLIKAVGLLCHTSDLTSGGKLSDSG